jgi:hypothetical protein
MGRAVFGQAVDAANQFLFAMTDLFAIFSAITIVSLLREKYKNLDDVKPEASEDGELPQMLGGGEIAKENVMFSDTHPGYGQMVASEFDSLRDSALASDATLDQFFSRPLRIASYDWGVGNTFFQTLNPWTLFFQNPRVINRISNYKLMRAKLCVKFTLNGNAFHYGRIICSYNPFPDLDDFTVDRLFFQQDVVAASQRPHVYLDPTNSQGGELCLPFFTYLNVLDIPNQDWQTMGEITMHSLQALKHANGATDTITVNVFAWAEEVKFAIPTQIEPGAITPQADEYSKKPVSAIAGAVAKAAGMLANIPPIYPFAKATELGAQAVGSIATLFGYSKPQILDVSMYHPKTKANLAATNAPEDSTKMTVDIKQELSIDPRTVGLSGDDELAINYIASRESFLTSFTWAVGTVQETLLFNMIVDPCLYAENSGELHFPACCFATMPFEYWRGTMSFRFQFVCSKYHKGRVKLVYDPTGNPSGTAEYNTAYTTIIDISDTTDFTIDCGWGQSTSYREHLPVENGPTQFGSSALTYNSISVPYGNGTLAVYVVNELTVPNTTINNDIGVNVFISAGKDFEVAAPTNKFIGDLQYRTIPEAMEVLPEAGEEAPPEEHERMDSAPSKPETINSMALNIPTEDVANLVHFGERISSFRQLLKRYHLFEVSALADGSGTAGEMTTAYLIRYNFPHFFGYQNNDVLTNQLTWPVNAGANRWTYAKPTFLHYAMLGYGAWRGSVRWCHVPTWTFRSPYHWEVTRVERDFPENNYNAGSDLSISTGLATYYNTNQFVNEGLSGTAIQHSSVNGTVSYEIPYYSRYRCTPCKRYNQFDDTGGTEPDAFQDSHIATVSHVDVDSTSYVKTYVSCGEDFNLFMYLGPPRFYRITSYPT